MQNFPCYFMDFISLIDILLTCARMWVGSGSSVGAPLSSSKSACEEKWQIKSSVKVVALHICDFSMFTTFKSVIHGAKLQLVSRNYSPSAKYGCHATSNFFVKSIPVGSYCFILRLKHRCFIFSGKHKELEHNFVLFF